MSVIEIIAIYLIITFVCGICILTNDAEFYGRNSIMDYSIKDFLVAFLSGGFLIVAGGAFFVFVENKWMLNPFKFILKPFILVINWQPFKKLTPIQSDERMKKYKVIDEDGNATSYYRIRQESVTECKYAQDPKLNAFIEKKINEFADNFSFGSHAEKLVFIDGMTKGYYLSAVISDDQQELENSLTPLGKALEE
jgi:hypothetical protein